MNDLPHPPRPPLAFRVGVVGHRPDRLQNANLTQLAGRIGEVLICVQDEVLAAKASQPALYDEVEPILRAISPLGEGTDRLFAEQAIALKFELCCVMPFPEAEFRNDFTHPNSLEPDSLARFDRLLEQTKTRFELDGCRADSSAAYGEAGRVVLNQSDLLVVVWDGLRQGKRGGTEETLDEARRTGVPVVWIDAHAPHSWQLLDATTPLPASVGGRAVPVPGNLVETLRSSVRQALAMPSAVGTSSDHERSGGPKSKLEQDDSERQPTWTAAVIWKGFRDIMADGKTPHVGFSISPFEEGMKTEWPAPDGKSQATPREQVVDRLRPFYAWPDKLAVIYADRFRSAFILVFLLAAAAVGLALLPIGVRLTAHHAPETVCIALELVLILAILFLVSHGQRRRWHERWIDYRLAAELVRHVRLVAPLGGARPFPQVPAHWATYEQPGASWMAWYVRAVERALGLPSVVISKEYLTDSLSSLQSLLASQQNYHSDNSTRYHRIEERLHEGGIGLLKLTLLCGGLHFLPGLWHGFELPLWLPPMLTFLCGFLPALGAAMAGIANQGEFRRIAKRSEAMRQQLPSLIKQVEELRHEIEASPILATRQYSLPTAALASDAARLLVNEVLDWRVVILDQPLRPPA